MFFESEDVKTAKKVFKNQQKNNYPWFSNELSDNDKKNLLRALKSNLMKDIKNGSLYIYEDNNKNMSY